MNMYQIPHGLRALALVCAMGLSSAQAAEPAPAPTNVRAGIFKAIEGEVYVLQGTTRLQPQIGQALAETDRIQTGPKSGAAVTLNDGTVISIGANSSVTLSSVRFDPVNQTGNLALQIVQGTLRMITGTLGKNHPESVKINTPTSVIGVRGTDFIVDVNS